MARYEVELEIILGWPSPQSARLAHAEGARPAPLSRVRVDRMGSSRAMVRAVVKASSVTEAFSEVVCLLLRCGLDQDAVVFSSVRRRHSRRAKERMVVGTRSGGDDGPEDTGLAGVREPRRPLPAPPSLYAEVPLPPASHRTA